VNSVILVGNGLSGKDHEFGDFIDSHDTVVRFGWYDNNLERSKKYTGSKTDIWVTAQYDPVRAKQKYDCIFQYSFLPGAYDEVFRNIGRTQEEQPGESAPIFRPFDRLWIDVENYLKQKRSRTGTFTCSMKQPEEYPKWSSLSVFAWLLLHHGGERGDHLYRDPDSGEWNAVPLVEQISVYGFDWWSPGDKDRKFSVDGPEVGKRYEPIIEFDFFGNLWMDGKIRDLHPDSEFHNEPRK